jgi:tetratricopeptide (TPR) repeat protein
MCLRYPHLLARTYTYLMLFDQAKEYFHKILAIFDSKYDKKHVCYSIVLKDFGEFHAITGNFPISHALINDALSGLEQAKHHASYRCYELLGDRYTRKKQVRKARSAYLNALKIAEGGGGQKILPIPHVSKKKLPFITRCVYPFRSYFYAF